MDYCPPVGLFTFPWGISHTMVWNQLPRSIQDMVPTFWSRQLVLNFTLSGAGGGGGGGGEGGRRGEGVGLFVFKSLQP